jgi:hypothetical protein
MGKTSGMEALAQVPQFEKTKQVLERVLAF